MRIYISDKKLVIVTLPKSTRFDLPIEVDKFLEHQIKVILNHKKSLADYTMKKNISQLL